MADEKNYFKTYEGNYNSDEIVDKLYKNSERYATWRLEKDKNFDIESFTNSINKIATEIQNGTLSRGKGRRYYSSALTDISSASDSAAFDLTNRVIDTLSKAPEPEREKYGDKYTLRTEFLNRFYGGNDAGEDLSLWTNGTLGASDLADMVDAYATRIDNSNLDYSDSPYTDKNDLVARARKLSQNLRDGTVDEKDSADWVALGGEKKFFDTIFNLSPRELTPWEKEWQEVEKLYLSAGRDRNYIAQLREKFFNNKLTELNEPFNRSDYAEAFADFATKNWTGTGKIDYPSLGGEESEDILKIWSGEKTNEANNIPGWLEVPKNSAYADQLFNQALQGIFTQGGQDRLTNALILKLYMDDLMLYDSDQFLKIKDNQYYIIKSFDWKKGTAIAYDYDTHTFTKVNVSPTDTPVLLNALKAEYRKYKPYTGGSSTGWGSIFAKNGSKLNQIKTLRDGSNILYALSGALLAQLKEQERIGAYNQSVTDRAKAKGLSEEDIRKGDVKASEDDSFNSWLRAASTYTDVAGAAASFIPVVGNAVGAILGTAGTVGNLVADAMDDSVSPEEMWTNASINAALTGLMLIPGGGTASLASKALKVAKTAVLVGAPLYAGTQVYKNWDRVLELWDKKKKGNLSHEEERELSMYVSMMAGTVTGTKANAGKAAKHLGNNFAGKTAAAISDPYIFFSLLGGDKRAKVVFRDMLKNTRPVKTSSTSNKKGVNYEFEDADGKKFSISKSQYDAMRKAEAEGRKAGLSGEELDRKIGDAWAKNHPDGPKTYATESTTQSKSWNVSDEDPYVKQQLTATTDPTGDVEIGGIKFSKESVKALKDAYKTASEGVTDDAIKAARNTDSVDDNLRSLYQHEVGMKAARDKFSSLAESSETIAGGVIDGNPIFKMSDTGRLSKYLRKIGIGKSDLDLVDTGESSVSRFLNSGEGSAFDSNSSVGRANIAKRVLQRKHGRDYLANGFLGKGIGTKGADFLLNNFNTNWELANNMGGIRTRTDELSDALVVRRLLLNSTEHKAKIASLEARSNFRNSAEGKKLIAAEEKRLGHTLTREEVDNLANKHKLKLLKLLKSAETARLNAEQKLGTNTEITVEQLLEIQSNVPAWKNLSYDQIKAQYDKAKEAGFTGDIVSYSKHVKDLRKLGKTASLVHQDNLDRIAQNQLDAENKLILKDFETSEKVDPARVALLARKEGLQGDDASIIKLLQSILYTPLKNRIVNTLKKATKSANTRKLNLATLKELLLGRHYEILVDKYRRANPTKTDDTALIELLRLIRNNNKTLKTVEKQYNIPPTKQAKVENAILNMLDETELNSIISKWSLTKKAKFGGRLERLVELRRNFISDNSYTSDELSSFKSGGILKAEGGAQLPDWYKKYYNFDNLIGWTNELDSSNSGSLSSSDWHKKAGNLEHAYKFNDAYINSGHVGKDILEYYNNSDISDINEFVKDYNNNIRLIDDRFNNEITYGSSGAGLGNKAYKNLYTSTVSNPDFLHYLGYNDSQDDIWGSTSWLRRADKYEKELKDLSDEELKLRTHVISDKNGKTYTIYKNADGTITLDKPNSNDSFDVESENGEKSTGISDNGGPATKKSKFDPELLEYLINLNIPDLLSAKRLFKNLRNNRTLGELGKRKKAHYLNYVLGHENVYGDFGALMSGQLIENNLLSNAHNFAESTANLELAAAMLLDSLLKANDSKKYYTNLDNTAIAKGKAASQAAELERYLENLKRAETNAGTSVAKHNADIDMEMGVLSSNTTNWNTWLSEQESRFRLKNVDNEELQRKLATQDLQNWWKNNVTDTPHILSLLNEYTKADTTRLAEIIKEVLLERQLNEQLYSAERFNRLRKIMKGNYWGMGDGSSNFTVFKKGGKVDDSRIKRRAEDLKELRKLIRHSITTNQKALDNLSKATLLELKRMMGI